MAFKKFFPNPILTVVLFLCFSFYAINKFEITDIVSASVSNGSVNTPPIANAGNDKTVLQNEIIVLDGTSSYDINGDQLTYNWKILEKPQNSKAILNDSNSPKTTFIVDEPGDYIINLVVNDGVEESNFDNIKISTFNSAPVANPGLDQTVFVEDKVYLNGFKSSDYDADELTYFWSLIEIPDSSNTSLNNENHKETSFIVDTEGEYIVQLIVNDGIENSKPSYVVINTLNSKPVADAGDDIAIKLGSKIRLDGSASFDVDNDKLNYSWSIIHKPKESSANLSSSSLSNPEIYTDLAGEYVAQLIISDGDISSNPDTVNIIVKDSVDDSNEEQSFDHIQSETIASNDSSVKLNSPTVSVSFYNRVKFLFEGKNSVQKGVKSGVIKEDEASVIRGRIIKKDGSAFEGVKISIKDHSEFGWTQSNDDGWFDIVVNGKKLYTLVYEENGYLKYHRKVRTETNDYFIANIAAMAKLDSRSFSLRINKNSELTVIKGNSTTDKSGFRRPVFMFPKDTELSMIMPNGEEEGLNDQILLRTTEITTGKNIYKSFPASAPDPRYVYAFEFSSDKSMSKKAEIVNFSKPVPLYLENFLNFHTGHTIESRYYDRNLAQWNPSKNLVAVKIVSIDNGAASLDIDGDGEADKLDTLGISEDELIELAKLYNVGDSIFRTEINHLAPWVFNCASATEVDSPPPGNDSGDPPNCDNQCCLKGCIVGTADQSLGEEIPVVGTPYSLVYNSGRNRTVQPKILDLQLSTNIIDTNLVSIDLEINVAGNTYYQQFSPAPNLRHTYAWDGLDAYGAPVEEAKAKIKIAYVYSYTGWVVTDRDAYMVHDYPDNNSIYVYRTWYEDMFSYSNNINTSGLGGWSLDVHHNYNVQENIFSDGSGKVSSKVALGLHNINRIAGGGNSRDSGVPALTRYLYRPKALTFADDGTLYFISGSDLMKLGTDGIITVLDIGSAQPQHIAITPQNQSLYIADLSSKTILEYDISSGTSTTVAGGGTDCYIVPFGTSNLCGDGYYGPATSVNIGRPEFVAVGPNGDLYFASNNNTYNKWAIFRVDQSGYISEVIRADGRGLEEFIIASDGSFYLSEYLSGSSPHSLIIKVATDGTKSIFAGFEGASGHAGDSGLASEAKFTFARGLALRSDGTLFVADSGHIRKISPQGIITTIGGGGDFRVKDAENKPALQTDFTATTYDLALDLNGDLYLGDSAHVVKINLNPTPNQELLVPNESGTEVYFFDDQGKHLKTVDSITGGILYTFNYDANDLLGSITDSSGKVTTIQRSGNNPTAIVSPYGQQTSLGTDSNGFLSSITNPAGGSYSITNNSDGLITQITNPNGSTNTFTYDSSGYLTSDTNALGGGWQLLRSESGNYDDRFYRGLSTISVQSGMGKSYTFDAYTRTTTNGNFTGVHKQYVNTFADGRISETTVDSKGREVSVAADGTATTRTVPTPYYVDPRFGYLVKEPYIEQIVTPGGVKSKHAPRYKIVSLADPADPLSHTSLELRHGSDKSIYDSATKTWSHIRTYNRGNSTTKLDDKGRIIQYAFGNLHPIDFSYDSFGRVSSITQGDGTNNRTTAFSYDSGGFLSQINNGVFTQNFVNDSIGRVTQSSNQSSGSQIGFSYDPLGNLTGLTTPNSNQHSFSYTPIDLISQYTSPNVSGVTNNSTNYSYNLDKDITLVTKPDGRSLNYSYDTATGQRTSLSIQRGIYNYFYEATKVCPSTTYVPSDLCHAGSPTGQLTKIIAPGGETLNFTYDGFLLTDYNWSGTINGFVKMKYNTGFNLYRHEINGTTNFISYSFDNVDNLIIRAGNFSLLRDTSNRYVTRETLGTLRTYLYYNGFGELTKSDSKYGSRNFYKVEYLRDSIGRIIEKEETVDSDPTVAIDYSYDADGRLSQVIKDGATTEQYSYDSNGNRLSATIDGITLSATYDTQDRLITYGDNTYTYNDNGDLATKTNSQTSETTTYNYDELGNLITVNLPDGRSIEYVIDGLNRRIGKKVDGVVQSGWLYQDQLNPIAELDGAGNIVSTFVYAHKPHVPAYMKKYGIEYMIISDQVGSVRVVVNKNTRQIEQIMDYDSFGNVILDTNPGFQPFGFAGGLYDRDTKLTRFGARDYDAEVGRWTVKDPIGFDGGDTNLYGYVANDPVNNLDPSGLAKIYFPGLGQCPVVGDSSTSYTLCCFTGSKLKTPKDRCECVCALSSDSRCSDACEKCFSLDKKDRCECFCSFTQNPKKCKKKCDLPCDKN